MSFDRDQEEEEVQREQHADHAATADTFQCAGMTCRKMTMATFVMLSGTGNIFVQKAMRKSPRASFDAAAFVWMHAAPESEVFSTDWQDPREFTATVTIWMQKFGGRELLEFAAAAQKERDRYMSSEFRILPSDLVGAEKKSRRGRAAR
jgi:hypothetical protein